MDWSLKSCTSTLWDSHNLVEVDRLTSLPNELLVHIFSSLPTKDVAATCILNKRLNHVFPFITNLDFDVSPISLCVKRPYAVKRYPIFVAFVNTVLQAHRSEYLTRFRLQVSDCFCSFFEDCHHHAPYEDRRQCLPDLKGTQLSAWISFPLNFRHLRELDLCILLKEPGDAQLPQAIFTFQMLEVLKLEVNIGLDQVISIPSYHLPNMRFLTLRASFVSDDSFLPRLLACCPLLEDLTYDVFTNHVSHLTIQSASLKRLSLRMNKVDEFEEDNTDIVLIHTPYLEYLDYTENLALCYSIPIMHCLVKAKLFIPRIIEFVENEVVFQQLINLITSVSYIQSLSLFGIFLMEFDYVDVKYLKDQLPVFPKLIYLKLGASIGPCFWNNFLLHLLDCSPVLEILVFSEGVLDGYDDSDYDGASHKLEREFFGSVHRVPSCCRYHLRRIVIKKYMGIPREAEIVQFFLRHALVLEELIIYLDQAPPYGYPIPDQILVRKSLMNLPKASVTCSIQVLW